MKYIIKKENCRLGAPMSAGVYIYKEGAIECASVWSLVLSKFVSLSPGAASVRIGI